MSQDNNNNNNLLLIPPNRGFCSTTENKRNQKIKEMLVGCDIFILRSKKNKKYCLIRKKEYDVLYINIHFIDFPPNHPPILMAFSLFIRRVTRSTISYRCAVIYNSPPPLLSFNVRIIDGPFFSFFLRHFAQPIGL
jgi:hypothetical protein